MTITGGGDRGLFGLLGNGAEVRNLGVVDVNIVGSDRFVGGLVGRNMGTVIQCHSSGVVIGTASVGGLVGRNSGEVTDSYSTSAVSGDDLVGGLVGANWMGGTILPGLVAQCYSTGTVRGTGEDVGGLVGLNIEILGKRGCEPQFLGH